VTGTEGVLFEGNELELWLLPVDAGMGLEVTDAGVGVAKTGGTA
jgi:hypothetical protein